LLRYGSEQLVCEHRFLEEHDNTEGFGSILEIVPGADEYDRSMGDGVISPKRLDELQAIHEGHLYVRQDQVRGLLQNQVPGDDGILCNEYVIPGIGEVQPHQLSHVRIVVHDKNRGHYARAFRRLDL
jgi:hypothetical protein